MLTLMGELVPSCPTLRLLPVGVTSCSSVIESETRALNGLQERKICYDTVNESRKDHTVSKIGVLHELIAGTCSGNAFSSQWQPLNSY